MRPKERAQALPRIGQPASLGAGHATAVQLPRRSEQQSFRFTTRDARACVQAPRVPARLGGWAHRSGSARHQGWRRADGSTARGVSLRVGCRHGSSLPTTRAWRHPQGGVCAPELVTPVSAHPTSNNDARPSVSDSLMSAERQVDECRGPRLPAGHNSQSAWPDRTDDLR